MKSRMIWAWLLGVGLLLAIFALWLLLLRMEVFAQWALVLLWISPAVAAFVASYLSPSHKIILGLSMAIPTAVFAAALNRVLQIQGLAVDFPGPSGGLILFIVVLVGAAVLSSLGGILGMGVSRGRH
ncbi:MAG: hypothetical protein EHM68_08895 [Lysobacterales bacterium]|nr:MAG: hypothetical protein EHM68_08895 [Xanthomonadales bacterium]